MVAGSKLRALLSTVTAFAIGVLLATSVATPAAALLPLNVSITFTPSTIFTGTNSNVVVTITNPNAVAVNTIAVTTPVPAGASAIVQLLAATCNGVISISAASYTMNHSSLAAGASCNGSFNVTSTTPGNYIFAPEATSANAPLGSGFSTLTVVPYLPLTITMAYNPSTVVPGGSSNLGVTVTNPNPLPVTTMNVTTLMPAGVPAVVALQPTTCAGVQSISAGALSLNQATLAAGASCSGSANVTATVAGIYTATASATSTQTPVGNGTAKLTVSAVAAQPPTVTTAFSPSSILAGGTSTVTITIANPNAQPLTGVSFADTLPVGVVAPIVLPTSNCGGVTSISAGQASLTNATLSAGASCAYSFNVSAAALGTYINGVGVTSNQAPTASASAALHVTTPTTTTLAASTASAAAGQPVTFTATVTGAGATGTVTFKDGATTIGSSPLAAGTALLTTSTLTPGNHSVAAIYAGDANFFTSTSNTKAVAVGAATTTTALNSSPNPSNFGQSVTLTATVNSQGGLPTGNVTFKDGSAVIGSVALSQGGAAVLTTSTLPAGGHALTAAYQGDAIYPASTSPVRLHNVVLSCQDNFTNATALPGASAGTASGTNAAATAESGEPNHANASTPLNSVWCKWTAPASGRVTFDTTGSAFDTTLAVYTGTSVNALAEVKSNDNISSSNSQSRLTFDATAGVTYAIALDGAGSATGNYVLTWTQGPAAPSLFAAVLPTSRSVMINATATAFATIINGGSGAATGCSLALPAAFPAVFSYQTTDGANKPVGTANTPVDIPAGGAQGFVFAVTPLSPLNAADVAIVFTCANTGPAVSVPGLNTLSLSASPVPTPDLIATGSTPSNDGIVTLSGSTTGFFSAATVNIGGAGGSITATVDDNGQNLPLTITLCRNDPVSGVCTNPSTPGPSTTSTIDLNEISTYAVFVQANGTVAFDPANNRLFLRFKTSDGVARGATSVAVRTQ